MNTTPQNIKQFKQGVIFGLYYKIALIIQLSDYKGCFYLIS